MLAFVSQPLFVAFAFLAAAATTVSAGHPSPMSSGDDIAGTGEVLLSTQHVFHAQPQSGSAQQDEDTPATASHGRQPGRIYLIRHAEKVKHGGKGLAEKGKERAQCLKHVFGHGPDKVGYIMAQAYKPDGKRSRPYQTVKPLADYLGLPVDTHCEREDGHCVAKRALHAAAQGHNVLICWQHHALTDVARAFGVHGLRYPSSRSDILFQLSTKGKVHAIRSEECRGLDDHFRGWHGSKSMKPAEKLVDDEAWAPGAGEHHHSSAAETSQADSTDVTST